MYKVTRSGKTLPNVLKQLFASYEQARSTIRKYLRTRGLTGNPAISTAGFGIIKT